ncbi:MAG: hypothetical protein HQK99_05530 [Nitrospirae bacterium]|nr:hypothetical protein [Nitrospirota bacterium]
MSEENSDKLYTGCYIAVVLAAVTLRIYKAYYTGIIYDEALTYFRFARDFNSAVSNYSTTNNHLLNSVFIYLSVKVMGQTGMFIGVPAIRLPAVFFGIVYVASVAVTIEAALRNKTIKILALVACLFNYFIFDLSILARGYAIALGAVYMELMLIVLYPRYRDRSMVILFSALNFIALGAMLTSLYTIVPLNIAFLAVIYHTNARQVSDKAFEKAFEMGSMIMCYSSFALAVLYYKVIITIVSASAKNSEINEAPVTILKSLITEGLFSKWRFQVPHLPDIMLSAMLCLAVLFILNIVVNKKTVTPAAIIIMSVLATSFPLAYIANKTGGLSLGFTRNHVFWLPLIVLTAGIIMEGALAFLVKAGVGVLTSSIILIAVIMTAGPLMSLHAVTTYDWKPQSVVGPLLRELRKTDAARHWKVGFSDKLEFNLYPYYFYNNEVYRINDSDVSVYHISEKNLSAVSAYKYDLFKEFDCVVVLAGPAQPAGRPR